MNTVDIILGLLLLYGLIRGFFRGFFAELASLAGFIAGIYGAVYFSHILIDFLAEQVSWNAYFINLISFAIIFFLIVFLISLAGNVLTKMANLAMLGIVNKVLGAAFGLIKAAVITSFIMILFNATNQKVEIVEEETLNRSLLYRPIKILAPTLLPSVIKKAKELDFIMEDEEI